jgi:hypothetical protein
MREPLGQDGGGGQEEGQRNEGSAFETCSSSFASPPCSLVALHEAMGKVLTGQDQHDKPPQVSQNTTRQIQG